MKTVILVAAHKEFPAPKDPLYLPVHAGAEIHDYSLPYQPDNIGDNISIKNRSFCELTVLYWAWKNLEADFIGLCHYRRYLCGKKRQPLLMKEAEDLISRSDIILPKPRNYCIETNFSQFAHAHGEESLSKAGEIVRTCGAEYSAAWEKVMKRTWGHRFNMLLMRRDEYDAYCSWLFSVLFELESRLNTDGLDAYNTRVFGFVAERLLDVWLEANGKQYLDVPHVYTEKQNWILKGGAFLYRKMFGKLRHG